MKATLFALVVPALVSGTPSLRHDASTYERLLERLDTLERAEERRQEEVDSLKRTVEALKSQLALQHRRLSDSCALTELPDGTCMLNKNMIFSYPVKFDNETTFDDFVILEGSVTLKGEQIVFSADTTTEFLGNVEFKGTRYDSDDRDSEFAVKFETEAVFTVPILFEDEVEFEHAVLFTGDVTMEGPDARRTRRRMRERDLGNSDEDDITFEILGRVDIEVESENEVHLLSETFFEEDVHVGGDEDNNSRRLKNDKNKKNEAKLFVADLDVVGGLLVEGLLDAEGDTLFHGDLVFTADHCLIDCDDPLTDNALCDQL